MAKSFKDVVQDSPRTGLGIPVRTKNPLSRTKTPPTEPPFGFLWEVATNNKRLSLLTRTNLNQPTYLPIFCKDGKK